jgi:hypothetical protein
MRTRPKRPHSSQYLSLSSPGESSLAGYLVVPKVSDIHWQSRSLLAALFRIPHRQTNEYSPVCCCEAAYECKDGIFINVNHLHVYKRGQH